MIGYLKYASPGVPPFFTFQREAHFTLDDYQVNVGVTVVFRYFFSRRKDYVVDLHFFLVDNALD
jgi:hypothetical protein